MSKSWIKWGFPVLAVIVMLCDGQLTQLFASLSNQHNIIAPQLLLIFFLSGYFTFDCDGYLITTAIVVGILYDLYYYGVIGIYTLCLPLTIFLFSKLQPLIPRNIPMYLILFLLSHFWLMVTSYLLQVIFGIAPMDLLSYIVLYLAPSLLINAILDLIFLFYGDKYYFNVTKHERARTSAI